MTVTPARYGAVAMTLHWLIAAAIIGLLIVGKYMHGLPNTNPDKFALYQLHKSFGITVLALSLLRLGWRFTHPAPALPAAMPAWERWAAHGMHFALYAAMIGMPLSGWARVSADPIGIPTLYFGTFEVPHLPFGADRDLSYLFHEMHELGGNLLILLLVGHVAAALKHHFWDRDDVLKRMLPGTRVE